MGVQHALLDVGKQPLPGPGHMRQQQQLTSAGWGRLLAVPIQPAGPIQSPAPPGANPRGAEAAQAPAGAGRYAPGAAGCRSGGFDPATGCSTRTRAPPSASGWKVGQVACVLAPKHAYMPREAAGRHNISDGSLTSASLCCPSCVNWATAALSHDSHVRHALACVTRDAVPQAVVGSVVGPPACPLPLLPLHQPCSTAGARVAA